MKYLLVMLLLTSPAMAQEYINTTEIVFELTAIDEGSGVEAMQFSNDGVNWAPPEPLNHVKDDWELVPGDGKKTVYVRFIDGAGNVGEPVFTSFVVDTLPPNGSIILKIKIVVE